MGTMTIAWDMFHKGDMITITTAKGAVTGEFVSTNSKGVNLKTAEGKIISRALATITEVSVVNTPADLFTDGETYTTAQLAAIFETTARALRMELRKLGMGVGKGQTYGFTATDARKVYNAINAK